MTTFDPNNRKKKIMYNLDDPYVEDSLSDTYAYLFKTKRKVSIFADMLALATSIPNLFLNQAFKSQPAYPELVSSFISAPRFKVKAIHLDDELVTLEIPVFNIAFIADSSAFTPEYLASISALGVFRGFDVNKQNTLDASIKPTRFVAAYNLTTAPNLSNNYIYTPTYGGIPLGSLEVRDVVAMSKYVEIITKGVIEPVPEKVIGNTKATFDVAFRVVLPLEYAMWATCVCEKNDFSAYPLMRLWNDNIDSYFVKNGMGKSAVERYVSPATFYDQRLEHERIFKLSNAKPRVNEQGHTVLRNGDFWYVPDGKDLLAEYVDATFACWKNDGTFEKIPEHLRNKMIAVDWMVGYMLYTNADGDPHFIDLKGSRAVTDLTIAQAFANPIGSIIPKDFIRSVADHYKAPLIYTPNFTFMSGFNALVELGATVGQLIGATPIYDKVTDKVDYTATDIAKGLVRYLSLVKNDPEIMSSFGARRLSQAMFWIDFFAIYTARNDAITAFCALEKQEVSRNTQLPRLDNPAVTTSGLDGLHSWLPHQVTVKTGLEQYAPRNVILKADPGGGKTALLLDHITTNLVERRVKRALYVAPGPLVRQMCRQIIKLGKGRLRYFVIDRRSWRRWTKLGLSTEDIRRLIKSQPENTIFLTNPVFVRTGAITLGMFKEEHVFYPRAAFLSNDLFDMVNIDESHKAKNLKSQQSVALSVLVQESKMLCLATGTLISNIVKDLLGQVALASPAILKPFHTLFDKKNVVLDKQQITAITKRIAGSVRTYTISNNEWSFLLPRREPSMHLVQMTEHQKVFYDNLVQSVIDEILKDKKLKMLLERGDLDLEAEIFRRLRPFIAKLEVFLGAPDSTRGADSGMVFSNTEGLSEQDLISPLVVKMDEIINAHFNGGPITNILPDGSSRTIEVKPDENKVLVLAYNISIVDHLFKHTAFKDVALCYKAGDLDTLDQFIEDPKYKVLIAAENTLKEGFDLQVASRIIRCQTPYTPGEYEQALARAFRPDVPDKNGSQKYNRELIWTDWIIIDKSIWVTKTARLFNKLIEKAKLEEFESNKDFQAFYAANEVLLENLDMIKLTLESVFKNNSFAQVQNTVKAYTAFSEWQAKQFYLKRARLKQAVEARVGRPITSEELVSLALVPAEHDTPKEWSSAYGEGYYPFVEGVMFHDKLAETLQLEPLSVILEPEDDEDIDDDLDDDEDYEEIVNVNTLKPTDTVVTEFGLGIVRKIRPGSNNISVVIPGVSKSPINLPRSIVYASKSPIKQRALNSMRERTNLVTLPRLTDGFEQKRTQNLARIAQDNLHAAEHDVETKLTKSTLKSVGRDNLPTKAMGCEDDVFVSLVNGQVLVWLYPSSDRAVQLLTRKGFAQYGTSVSTHIKSWRGLKHLIDYFKDYYAVPSNYLRSLELFKEAMKLGLVGVNKLLNNRSMFNALWESSLEPADAEYVIKPIITYEDGEVYIMINGKSCPSARELLGFNDLEDVGVTKFVKQDPFWYKFYPSPVEARDDLISLEEDGFIITNQPQVAKDLKSMKR